jgi:hypothetical protein
MSFENITNNPMIEMANLKKKPNIFSTENKDKIFKILKINKSNLFTKQNINTLIKMVSNKNKPKMKILLKNIEQIKNNGLNKKNKNIINELLKIKELIIREKEKHIQLVKNLNKNRGFNINKNSVNIIREPLTINNRVNISKITRMVDIVQIYFNILEPNIQEIFKTLFRQNIKNKISEKESNINLESTKIRKLLFNKGEIRKKFDLIPSIYDSSIPGIFKLNDKSLIGKGGYGKVYKNIVLINKNNKTKRKNLTYIFKIINDNENDSEFKSLVFNICLLASLYLTNNDGIKYFCDLYEFGKIKSSGNHTYYAIMENGGIELYKYSIIEKPLKNKLYDVLSIIKQCAEATLVLHKFGIIHCDIKPENFLVKEENGENHIKIIDFGYVKKNGTLVDDWFGTQYFSPPDFFYSIQKDLKYEITVKNDIYGLGIMFIELLSKILNLEDNYTINNKLFTKIKKKINLNNLKITVETIIEKNIKQFIEKLNDYYSYYGLNENMEEIIHSFCEEIIKILKKITYLEGNYNDLSAFINDIDNLLDILKTFPKISE